MLKDLRKVLLETYTDPFSRFVEGWGHVETASQLLEERAHRLGKIHLDDVLEGVYRIRAEKEGAEIRARLGLLEV